MRSRLFVQADPFLRFILLILLAFTCLSLFMLGVSGLVNLIWGINFLSDPAAINDFTNPETVHVYRLLLLFQHLGLFVVPAFLFAQLTSTDWKSSLSMRAIPSPFLAIAIVGMILALPGINALAWLNEHFTLPEFLGGLEASLSGMEDEAARITDALTASSSFTIFVINIVLIALIPAIGEELIFRALLIPILAKWTGNKHAGIWISACLFSAMHMQFYGFIPRFLLGAFLGYLFYWSRSIWTPIVAHFINNALALTLLFTIQKGMLPAELDEFQPDLNYMIFVAIASVLLGLCLYIGYKKSLELKSQSLLAKDQFHSDDQEPSEELNG